GYPDSRVAVVDTAGRRVLRWIDLHTPGNNNGTRPLGLAAAPINATIYRNSYLVVMNEYANFASVIDTATDGVIGEFQTGFYGEDLTFNKTGTRLYATDRFKDAVHVFDISPGPFFTQVAEIATGTTDLERANPRDLALSADDSRLYVANTLGHTIAVINTSSL